MYFYVQDTMVLIDMYIYLILLRLIISPEEVVHLIPARGRQTKVCLFKFKASLDYLVSSKTARAT